MKSIRVTFCVALLGLLVGQAQAGEKYTLQGDLSEHYQNGDFVIWTAKEKKSATSTAVGMSAASTMSTSTMSQSKPAAKSGAAVAMGAISMAPPSSDASGLKDSLNIVAEAKLVNGKFIIEGEVDGIKPVYYYVLNSVSADGIRRAPTKGQGFLLEPGNLTMTIDELGTFAVQGGEYNDAVYNSWKLSDEYAAAKIEMRHLYTEVDGETEQEKRSRLDAAAAAQSKMLEVETEGRKKTALSHPNVLARKLAIQTAWLTGRWTLEGAYGIEKLTPNDPWVKDYIAKQEAYYAKRSRHDAIGRVGGDIKDFEADTLAGDVVSLKDVRSKNKYILLEFWASWCGPCRSEIPHMKEAYADYHKQGFEILSFTIDDDRDDWQDASEEENMPWLDTGFGKESEAPTMYEVTGVPANYLVDGATGKIIARNLRGHKLDEELEKLFGN